jgi:type IV pilus assembly protein PilY1
MLLQKVEARFAAVGKKLLVMCGLLFALPGFAQHTSDIDIYGSPGAAGDAPNVLIVLDNTANWNTAFTNEIAALVALFNGLPANRFRVGIMMFTETGGGNTGPDGGYVRAAPRLIDASHKPKMAALLNSLDKVADKSNGGKAGATLAEAYYYFSGGAADTGNNKQKTDFQGNTSGNAASNAIYAMAGNALTSKAGTTYTSPVISGCQRNYIIYISNGTPSDNNADNTSASNKLTAAYAAISKARPGDISLTGVGSPLSGNVSDEWARFMNASPQLIKTFTLDVDKVTTGQGPGWTKLLKSMANVGGGQYYDVSSSTGAGSQIANALTDIFNQIQAVDSVFASASLPVSVNARGTYLNQIFMGMFRPDGDAHPRWKGNLKQYKFGYDAATDNLFLSDANGRPAVSGTTGFLSPSAASYWTAGSTYWTNAPIGTPPSASDLPDGEVVEKGGVAQRIRAAFATSQDSRKIYTCISCAANTNLASNAAAQFTTANSSITAATLGVPTATEKDTLLNWIRGADNASDELGPGGTTTIRPSVHGDVLHSRPAVINYGGATGVVVFYGANDGMLRAVNGSQTGALAGNELWSFIPEEHLLKLNRLRTNTPDIRLSPTIVSTPATATTPVARDYFVDGPIGVYQKAHFDGSNVQVNDKVYIYVGMRRGGRSLYAIDVTNPLTPIVAWKKTQSDISVLGQTWSEPKLAKIKGNVNPVLIFGAGYDAAAEDVAPQGVTTMGNAVLILDAYTGALLKKFDTVRSVPADVALVDTDFDGLVDRVYAADQGGNVYRIDLENSIGAGASAFWGMYKLAALSGAGTRKFFYPPDVVVTPGFTALMLGTGDREKPLATASTDAFFTLKDTRVSKGTPATTPSVIIPSDLGLVGAGSNEDYGCFIPMSTAGEKIVNAPATVGGITYFSTNKPVTATASCSANLGEAKVYSAPLFCKASSTQTFVGGGLPPSPVTGIVTVSFTNPLTNLTEQKQIPFIIGAPNSKGSGIEGTKVTPSISPVRTRRYWYLENPR